MAAMAFNPALLDRGEISRRVQALKRRRAAGLTGLGAGLGDPVVGMDVAGDNIYQGADGSCYTMPANAPASGPYYVDCPGGGVAVLPPANVSALLSIPDAAPLSSTATTANTSAGVAITPGTGTNASAAGSGGPGSGGFPFPKLNIPTWFWWVLIGMGVVVVIAVVKR
jgi:hypothetical protein